MGAWAIPLLASLFGGLSTIWEKVALGRSHISWRIFLVMLFLWLFIFTAVLLPFFHWVKPEFLSLKYVILFVAEILVALLYNYYYYRSLEHQNLCEIEVASMTAPITKILFAAIIFPAERNIHVVIAAGIAALALLFAHVERRHLQFDKYSLGMLFYIILFSCEALIIKELLDVWSPVTLYAVRCLILLLAYWIIVRPNFQATSKNDWWSVIRISIVAVPMMVLSFYGYHQFGVIYTTLILLLMPLIVFAASFYYFKEKINVRIIVAAVVIVAAILYVNLVR